MHSKILCVGGPLSGQYHKEISNDEYVLSSVELKPYSGNCIQMFVWKGDSAEIKKFFYS